MSCEKYLELLSQEMDGALPGAQRAELEAHRAACAACRAAETEWRRAGELLRDLPVQGQPTAEAMWADVQRAIRLGQPEVPAAPAGIFGWRLGWAAAILVTVLLGAGAIALRELAAYRQLAKTKPAERPVTVEYVETEIPDASTMVYEDADTGWTVIWVAGVANGGSMPEGT